LACSVINEDGQMETGSSNMKVGKIDLDRGARRLGHLSEKRLAANRRNAQKSTGPRTISTLHRMER
jgi:hypothetical protein